MSASRSGIVGWWFLVTTCLPLVIVAQEVPVARTEEVFTVGFADDDLFFGWIGGLSVAPDGRVLVHDADPGDGPAVTVLAPNGAVVARWGVVGEGPGELSGGPAAVAVEGESVLIAGSVGRIGIYDWSGEELSRSNVSPGMFWEAAVFGGRVVAWQLMPQVVEGKMGFAATLGPVDGGAWSTRTIESMHLASPLTAPPLLVAIPGRRLVVGYGDEYSLRVVASESGETLGLVTRDVSRRSQDDTDAFHESALRYFAHPEETPDTWSTIVRRSAVPTEVVGRDSRLPVIRKILWGPPGVLWVERGLGIDDEYAAPLDRPDDSRLWDTFKVTDDNQVTFLGPVALPRGFRPLAGNGELMAGVVWDELGRLGVRVLRMTVGGLAANRR
ncbi:MAG: hypothetical protein F4Y21_09895 [Gemmatimonadetes bacterium]|nr:hypothetical protein [Gemmatimonadota bacterium]